MNYTTSWFLLLTACEHQYIAIPGAVRGDEHIEQSRATDQATTVTIVEGDPHLTPGESVTVVVEFAAVTDIEFTDLLLYGDLYGTWDLELTEEEVEAGTVELEIHALDRAPTTEWCQRDYRGVGRCYNEADEGITYVGVCAQNETSISTGVGIPVTLDPLRPPDDDICASFTVDDCCADEPGIDTVSCYVLPPCWCPEGTVDGGVQADGTTRCDCP